MSNAPVIKEVIKPLKKIAASAPPVQQTATPRKQAETSGRVADAQRRASVVAAAERSAAARARRGGGIRSLLAEERGGVFGGATVLARTLGGIDK